jgi:hypothetical protein
MDRDDVAEEMAQELYEKIWDWVESRPGGRVDLEVIKTGRRLEVVNPREGALDITVLAPDQFSARAPRNDASIMSESEMLETVRRWLSLPIRSSGGAD